MKNRRRLANVALTAGLLFGCAEPADQSPAFSGLRVSQVLGADDTSLWEKATVVRPFEFPAEHGPHPTFRSEWWYLTSVLTGPSGEDIGVQFTLFRQGLSDPGVGPWQTGQAYMGHLGITDVSDGRHESALRFTRGHPRLAGVEVTETNFRAHIEDWRLEGLTEHAIAWRLVAGDGDRLAVDLDIRETNPPVLQGDEGLSHKGPGSASYYFSMPRLTTSGFVSIDGEVTPVEGLSWLDREWSTSVLGDHLQGWDWFALQLADGRSVMMFQLRRKDGGRDDYDHGQLIDADQSTHLGPGDYTLTPRRVWHDDAGVGWPVEWQLEMPVLDDGILTLRALIDDQRMALGVVYWEGIIEVLRDGRRIGRGYMELTGYE